MIKKVALKLGYIGTNFFGSQRQKNFKTIDGELINSLIKMNMIKDEKSYQSCCRTDRGVSAITYVISFCTNNTNNILEYPKMINSKIDGNIWIYNSCLVPLGFSPRFDAIERTYLYIIEDDNYDLNYMIECSKLFIGKNDYYNFCKINKKNISNTTRTIYEINIERNYNKIYFEISANSFLWKMVRKMIYSLLSVGKHKKNKEWIKKLLDPKKYKENIPCVGSDGLILKDIKYNYEIKWNNDYYAINKSMKKIHNKLIKNEINSSLLNQIYCKLNKL